MILEAAGGAVLKLEDFRTKAVAGEFSAAWIVGGYPEPWVDKELAKCVEKIDFLVAQDLFENEMTQAAKIVLPACAWVEREGSFVNASGLMQPFERAIDVPDGAKRDGQYLYEIAGFSGLFRAERVRELMAETIPGFANIYEPPVEAVHAH